MRDSWILIKLGKLGTAWETWRRIVMVWRLFHISTWTSTTCTLAINVIHPSFSHFLILVPTLDRHVAVTVSLFSLFFSFHGYPGHMHAYCEMSEAVTVTEASCEFSVESAIDSVWVWICFCRGNEWSGGVNVGLARSAWPFNWWTRTNQGELSCSCARQWFQGVRTIRLGLWFGIVYDEDIIYVDSKEERPFSGNEDTRIEVTWIQDGGSRSREQTEFAVCVWGCIESEDLRRRRMPWGCMRCQSPGAAWYVSLGRDRQVTFCRKGMHQESKWMLGRLKMASQNNVYDRVSST